MTSPSPTTRLRTRSARTAGLAAGVVLVACCCAASLAIGSRPLALSEVLEALRGGGSGDAHAIVWDLRIPRTELGLLVGAALGAAGALMQGALRNPLAEAGILGINAGASLAVVVAIAALGVGSVVAYTGFALIGAGVTAVLVFALAGSAAPVRLALAGAVLGQLCVALTSAVLLFDAQTLNEFRFWAVGSLAGRDQGAAASVLPFFAAGIVVALAAGRRLNALALGDDVARGLGARPERARVFAGIGFVLLAGAAVSAAGPIAFVGLAVPHVARGFVGPDYRWIVPYSIVGGALMLLAGDVLGRVVARPAELQVGIVTAIAGAPVFVWLVRRHRLVAL